MSGPGPVSFADPNAEDTTAEFSGPGDYVLRLLASDGALEHDDEVAITVRDANQAPAIDAGADQTLSFPDDSTTLVSTVSDHSVPSRSSLTIAWSQLSGAGVATFTEPTAATTSVSFDVVGAYVLRLTVSDGEATSVDDITVSVLAENLAPVVDAGEDQATSLPVATVSLSGTASDDGFPGDDDGSGATARPWASARGTECTGFTSPHDRKGWHEAECESRGECDGNGEQERAPVERHRLEERHPHRARRSDDSCHAIRDRDPEKSA